MDLNKIMITIDLEDWFQVENFKNCIPFSQWSDREQRFEYSTRKLLRIFDEKGIKATFFVLGWNAEQAPELVREIHNLGHEIASHGYSHKLCSDIDTEALREDIKKSKSILEDLTGSQVNGYRAPGFSITDETILHLKEIGYTYDSSYNSFGLNHRHGKMNLTQYNKKLLAYRDSEGFWELPISNLGIGKIILPWGGGGYFRLLNKTLFSCGVKRILSRESGYMFYAHPWEIDHRQPRVKEAGLSFRFRHYLNLKKFKDKLSSFIESFQNCSFVTCSQYIKFLETGNNFSPRNTHNNTKEK